MIIRQCESCVQSGCRICSQSIKNNNASTIQSVVCNCFNATKRSFCANIWQWMKHESTILLWLSDECTAAGEGRPKQPKTQTSSGKILASVFWDTQGILLINYLEKGRTNNSKYYIALSVCLKEENAKKRSQMKKKVPCHKSIAMMAKLHELLFKLLLQPPYSKDPVPGDYRLFADLKRMLQGERLALMKTGYWKLMRILRPKTNRFIKKRHRIVREALESVYHPWRRLR